jgi:L-arabinokinase
MRPATIDIPFIARRSTRDRSDTRRRLGIGDDRPAVLASFDSLNIRLPADASRASAFRTVKADADTLDRHGLCYQDVVAAVDVVVSKPGYGIVSECVANETALLYAPRTGFAEYELFVAEMPRVLRCRLLARDDLIAGRWQPAIDALLRQPPPPVRPGGVGVAVDAILELANGTGETR